MTNEERRIERDRWENEQRIMRMTPAERDREQDRIMVAYLQRLDAKQKARWERRI